MKTARPIKAPYDPGMEFARQAFTRGDVADRDRARAADGTAAADNASADAERALRTQPEKQCPGPGEPHQPAEAGSSRGVNIAPGSDDDGWVVPPPVTLSDGTQVQLYKDGEALQAGYRAIERAKHRVCLESYIFADDDTGRAFADLLSAKARQGLRVHVVYDSVGSVASDRAMFRNMARSGVRVEEFHPIRPWEGRFGWRPANRDHRKMIVVDDEIAGMGGLNVGVEYSGSWIVEPSKGKCDFWRDTAIGVRGPGAKLFLRAFGRTWNYIHKGGRIGRAEFHHNLTSGDFGVLASVPTRNSPLRPFLCDLMKDARKSIYLTMAYFAPDDELVDELCKAAKRGVRVRLIVPGRSDVHLLTIAARSFYETLMNCGVEVYERQAVVLHAKTIVVDGRTSVVGSTNLDYRSIEYNLELSAIVRNETFGGQMQDLFENDVRYSKKISPSEWRKRPYWDRFVQWSVSRARYLL
jgi:cardiolipin synthase A/B